MLTVKLSLYPHDFSQNCLQRRARRENFGGGACVRSGLLFSEEWWFIVGVWHSSSPYELHLSEALPSDFIHRSLFADVLSSRSRCQTSSKPVNEYIAS